jgi:hypothetical protein
MKITCAVVASDDNPLYIQFWPSVKRAWREVVGIPVKLILVAEKVPDEWKDDPDIILFAPIPEIHSAFIAQCVRLFYPALLGEAAGEEGGIVISDMDMIPTSRAYYHASVADCPDEAFVNYRDEIYGGQEYPMCYNAALPAVWGNVFGITSLQDIKDKLQALYATTTYTGEHGGLGWGTDQLYLRRVLSEWQTKSDHNQLVLLRDFQTGFRRLDRIDGDILHLSAGRKILIQNHAYGDFHMLRPYEQYKSINDEILDLVCLGPGKVANAQQAKSESASAQASSMSETN